MTFMNTTLAKAAFKKAFGKAHTANDKELGNESIRSFANVRAADLFADPISSLASETVANGFAVACTGNFALPLVADASSDGLSYAAVVPAYHPLKTKINPETGALYQTGDRVAWIIPDSYGDDYRALVKKDGAIVSPFAMENWVLDTSAGVITSELPLLLDTSGTLECYVYVGTSVQDYLNNTVQGGGTPGALAYYQADKTIAPKSSIRVDAAANEPSTLTLGEGSNLIFSDVGNDFNVSVRASEQMLESYELKWPTTMATEPGQVLATDANGQLFFQAPSSVQKGAIGLPTGSKMISVVYETPFYNAPTVVEVQWSVSSNVDFPAIIPNVIIDQITREGFIARWTHPVPSSGYILRWHAFLAFDYTPVPLTAYITPSDYGAAISAFAPDYGTLRVLGPTLSSNRNSVQSFSTSQAAFIAGGREDPTTIVDVLQKLFYATESIVMLTTTLVQPKAKGASVGSQLKGYLVGGRDYSGASSSILMLDSVSESSTVLGVDINGTSESKGAFNAIDYGFVVLDGSAGEVIKLAINTDTLSQVTALGFDDVSCGCNSAGSGLGYLSRNATSEVLKYRTDLDTVSVLGSTLRVSTQGQSCAFNSLVSGFFVGSEGVDSLDFATETVSALSSDLVASNPGTSNAFQSQGLL